MVKSTKAKITPALGAPTKMERYMGFLVQEWAKMAKTALVGIDQPAVKGSTVLDATTTILGAVPGLRLEFGVWRGNSIRRCATKFPEQHWYGFDSFEGFPDDGRVDWQKPFKVIQLPDTPPNVTLVKGYFSDTLDAFLTATPGPVSFVNIDCDIYSSTVDIFTALEKHAHIQPGLVIYFDELINYVDYMWNESLALFEMLDRTGLGVEWLCIDQHLRDPQTSAAHFHAADHPTWNDDMRAGYWMQASCRLTDMPMDCGPLQDPQYRAIVSDMLAGYYKQEAARIAALSRRTEKLAEQEAERQARLDEKAAAKLEALKDRDRRLAAAEVEREERLVARKALEKQRREDRKVSPK